MKRRAKRRPSPSRGLEGNLRTFSLVANTLAKDKEISDRWRGLETSRTPAISPTASSARWSMRWSPPCGRLSAPLAPLLQAQGQMVRQDGAETLGPQCAAAHVRRRSTFGTTRATPCLTPTTLSRRKWRNRQALLRRALDRCAGAAWQAAGRLRASDGALRASLCAVNYQASRAT